MFDSLLTFSTLLLSLAGISLLIFIHELGHYFAARLVGMKVEVFSIGFGKPLIKWKRGEEVWQIGCLPFGGYVRMAGMEAEEGKDLTKAPGNFFSKGPWSRLFVVSAGPLVNIAFALLVFFGVWSVGGWQRSFSQHTHLIGWVDPLSDLYKKGIRPGDLIETYNGTSYHSAIDHIQAPTLSGEKVEIEGYQVNPKNGAKTPFKYEIKTYDAPQVLAKGIQTAGIIAPANYLLYDRLPNGEANPLPKGSSIEKSGLEYGDRLYWADGEILFSKEELLQLLTNDYTLLSVMRQGQLSLVRVPRVLLHDLKIDAVHKAEIGDWQHLEGLAEERFSELYYIPFDLDDLCRVEGPLAMIDPDKAKERFPSTPDFQNKPLLLPGDRIVAVDGKQVTSSHKLLTFLQERQLHLIVERAPLSKDVPSWLDADAKFLSYNEADAKAIEKLASSIGSSTPLKQEGRFVLLDPVKPMKKTDLITDPQEKSIRTMEWLEQRKQLETLSDPEERAQALALFDKIDQQLVLGVSFQDHKVWYRPTPGALLYQVSFEIGHTLQSLVSGNLSPKWMSGPIGIVQVMQASWRESSRDALYWLGAISLNLGLINLLPIPVLDGGYIIFSLWEIITRKRLSPKAMERMILPFSILLITLMVLLVLNDVRRLLPDVSGWF